MGKYRDEIEFEDAEREQLYAKGAIMGGSGSGKTVSALKMAYGLTGGDWSKIYVADTENKRSLAYRGTTHTGLEIGRFKHLPVKPPYDTEKFMDIIDVAIEKGAEVLVFDSISHQWDGTGGVLDAAEKLGAEFWHWKKPKRDHHKFKDYIQQAPLHIIVTMRTKQEYAVIPGGGNNGKNAIQKLGMKPIQENEFDYEFLFAFHIDEDNLADVKKDNTGLFKGESFRVEVEHGEKLRGWLVEGKEVTAVWEDKQAEEERRKELIAKFAEKEKLNDEFLKYFANKEIKLGTHYKNCSLEDLEEMNKEVDKAEEERQEMVEYFTESRNVSDKSRAFYDKLEAEKGKIHEWPLAYMKGLYKKLKNAEAKQQKPQEPKQEEPAQTPPPEEPKVEDDKVSKVLSYIAYDPKVEKVANEFMTKMKIESVQSCKPEQLEMLLKLTERRAKTVEKERTTA